MGKSGPVVLQATQKIIVPLRINEQLDLGYEFLIDIPPKTPQEPSADRVDKLIVEVIFYNVSLSDPTDRQRVISNTELTLTQEAYEKGKEANSIGYYPKEKGRKIEIIGEDAGATLYIFEKPK